MKHDKFEPGVWHVDKKDEREIDTKVKDEIWRKLQINQWRRLKFFLLSLLILGLLSFVIFSLALKPKKESTSIPIPEVVADHSQEQLEFEAKNKMLSEKVDQLKKSLEEVQEMLKEERNLPAALPQIVTKIEFQDSIIRDTIFIQQKMKPEILQVFVRDTIYLPAKPIEQEPQDQLRAEIVQFNFTEQVTRTTNTKTNKNRSLQVKVYNK